MVTCRKRAYRDRVAALLELARIANRDNTRRPKSESRAYLCPSCNRWHLTSRKEWKP